MRAIAVALVFVLAADPPHGIGLYETNRLRDTMIQWLTTNERISLPGAVVLSTPVKAIEAWIIAALLPRQRVPETIADPARWLVDKGKLRESPSDGKPWKELYRYRDDFAPRVVQKLTSVRKVCAEAERTLHAVEQRRLELESRERTKPGVSRRRGIERPGS